MAARKRRIPDIGILGGGFGGIGYFVPSLTSSAFGLEVQDDGGFSGIAMMKWYLILDTRLIDDDDCITMMK